MKNEWFTNAIGRGLHSSKLSPLPQVSRTPAVPAKDGARTLKVRFPRTPPILWLVEVQARRPRRWVAQTVPRQSMMPGRREKLASLRAAELADWQASGGDFLRASHSGDSSRQTSMKYDIDRTLA